MRKIIVFNFVTVDGYFAGPKGEIEWFKTLKKDDEFKKFTSAESKSGSTALFGHKTYEMMKEFWPTPAAAKIDPEMANLMNNMEKIVFSKTLQKDQEKPNWQNIKILREINPQEIKKIKEQPGKGIVILGSGEIVAQLTDLGLIDEYQLVVVPIIQGSGKSMFKDVSTKKLILLEAKAFKNGVVLLRYKPA